jgi:hypothetical protein
VTGRLGKPHPEQGRRGDAPAAATRPRRLARPSPLVDRTRPAATPAPDGWPPPRGLPRGTEAGLQAGSPCTNGLTCALAPPLPCGRRCGARTLRRAASSPALAVPGPPPPPPAAASREARMPASRYPAWGRAVMTPGRWRGIVGVKVDSSGCPPGRGGNDSGLGWPQAASAPCWSRPSCGLPWSSRAWRPGCGAPRPPAPPTAQQATQADRKP